MKFLNILFLTVTVWLLTSCVGDLDFDQANDFSATPTYAVPLLNFEFNQDELSLIRTNSTPVSLPPLQIPTNKDGDFKKIEFQFEGSNSFEEYFTVGIRLLDENRIETHMFEDIVLEGNDLSYSSVQELNLVENSNVLNSTFIAFELSYNGTVTITEPGELSLTTAGIFHYTIE